MTIEKINFSYPRGSLQSVFDTETMTALELASKTSQKVDECVDIVNGVEQIAIEATAIVDDMQLIQNQFIVDNSDSRSQLVTDNQNFIDGLLTAKDSFVAEITDSKLDFEVAMIQEIDAIVLNADTLIEANVNTKIDTLLNDGTIEGLVNEIVTEETVATQMSFSEITGPGVITGLNVLSQSSPDMSVLISSGVAHLFNGKRYNQLTNNTIVIAAADPLYSRIDIVYINNLGVLTYGKGEAKAVPTAPTPINGLILAEIRVNINTLVISLSNITDKRVLKTNFASITEKINDIVYNVKDFGAIGDGVTDDTIAIQAAVNAAPFGGTIYGSGKLYLVSKILLKSNIIFKNFRLKTKPSSNTLDYFSPITIGNDVTMELIKNVIVENVHIDGNRSTHTNIINPENGGRHGFRLIGLLDNIVIRDCSANNCASDGICIFQTNGIMPIGMNETDPRFTNIRVENCTFEWNRRHGGSCDSVQNLIFKECSFNHNGNDINGGVTEGDKGDIASDARYGNGFDAEGYNIGSVINDIHFEHCYFKKNNRGGILFYEQTDQATVGYLARKGIKLISCHIDAGVEPVDAESALILSSNNATKLNGDAYSDIDINNCTIEGRIILRSCANVTIIGGSITNGIEYAGLADNCKNVIIDSVLDYGKKFYTDNTKIKYILNTENGILTLPEQPYVKMNMSVSQIIPANVSTKLQFTSRNVDVKWEYDVDNFLYRPSSAGVYMIMAHLGLTSVIGNRARMFVKLGGVEFADIFNQEALSVNLMQATGQIIVKLEKDTTLEIFLNSTNALSIDVGAGYERSYLMIAKIA